MVQTLCRSLVLAAALSGAAPAVGQSTSPLGPNPAIAGERTEVMTLGTFHLSERKDFDVAWLEPLLARLAEYRPAIITSEGLSGEQCAMMKAAPDAYADAFESYCWDLTAIEKATGFSVPAANAEIRKTLDSWPAQPTAAQRRRLAMLFIAAGERPSAMVQWLRLPAVERRAADGLDPAMLEILNRTNGKKNENFDIAATLAARLGLERVYPVDDHSSDAVLAHVPAEFEAAQRTRFEGLRKGPLFMEYQRDMAGLKDAGSVLAYYRKINAPHAQDAQIQGDFGGALAADGWGRQYVGWWEARNLRMAANIRASFVRQPGARVLNIVGSSHKPWYDALMRMMSDVEVVDAETTLR